ncbi:MAG: hypothetical protein IKQ55_13375 [Kiritimatiellae bacterium]|nr:hypothetical protein [Kiritimatiellia bacterium]
MQIPSSIPVAVAAAATLALLAAGCATTDIPPPEPFRTSQVEAFLKSARDPREMGITTLTDPASGKPRFDFANRPHMGRSAELPVLSKGHPCPFLDLKTGTEATLRSLIDTSSRQSWLVPAACPAMFYRPVKPPLGEYPDHVDSQVPGYAGIANKLIAQIVHVESPVFYVPMADGHLGPLARPESPASAPAPDTPDLAEKTRRARARFRASVQAVIGAEMLRAFDWVRLDFPRRRVRLSSNGPYKPPVPEAVAARLPMLNWRGRPAVAIRLDGVPATAVLDTGGDFDLSLPAATHGDLAAVHVELGGCTHLVPVSTHESLGLPADFPPRIGARLLARYAVVLDYKANCVWFEDPDLAAQKKADAEASDDDDLPVQYRGIVP